MAGDVVLKVPVQVKDGGVHLGFFPNGDPRWFGPKPTEIEEDEPAHHLLLEMADKNPWARKALLALWDGVVANSQASPVIEAPSPLAMPATSKAPSALEVPPDPKSRRRTACRVRVEDCGFAQDHRSRATCCTADRPRHLPRWLAPSTGGANVP